jgi:spore coat-associated protein N
MIKKGVVKMNNWQKSLIGTALASTLAIGAGLGTYAWFNAESKATGVMVNGSFSLGEMGQLFNQQKFAPSQLLFSDWQTIKNTGSLDQILRATYTHNTNSVNANVNKYKVGYIALKYKVKPSGDVLNAYKYKLEALLNDMTNPIKPNPIISIKSSSSDIEVMFDIISNENVSKLTRKLANKTITLGDGDQFWNLKNNEYIDIVFGVKLSKNAGNEFQGVNYASEFKVHARQTDNGAEYQSE